MLRSIERAGAFAGILGPNDQLILGLKHAKVVSMDAPDPYYIAFIDEAGDPGLKTVRPIDAVGGTEWLFLGAVVIRATHDKNVVRWVRSIMTAADGRNRTDLHYRDLPNFRRKIVCAEMSKFPIRAFVLASNKKNMRQYRNLRAERVRSQQWFCNFCLKTSALDRRRADRSRLRLHQA